MGRKKPKERFSQRAVNEKVVLHPLRAEEAVISAVRG
jgi:hypothetical protein